MLKNISFKMPDLPKLEVPKMLTVPTIDYDKLNRAIDEMNRETNREKEEKTQREKDTLAAVQGLLELTKDNPTVQQHIQTLIQNTGNIANIQTVHSGATGVQNITNNTGIQAEEMLKLLQSMRELSDVLAPEHAAEVQEAIDDLQEEVQKPDAKPGRIKASLTYLKSLFTNVIVDPATAIAKKHFTDYAQEKAPEIVQSIDDLFKSMNS
jgi:hypothetical protein